MTLFAQEDGGESPFGISADIVSRYVWRGSEIGSSPNIQPSIAFSSGGFSAGVWGSYDFDFSRSSVSPECDLFVAYEFDFGLGLNATDYYNQDFRYFDYDDKTGAHTFEIGATFTTGGLTLSAYKFLNMSKATYVEASYKFKHARVFVGGGDKSYLSYTESFNICNVGLHLDKEVRITDKWTITPFASFIVNPNVEEAILVVGITL